MAWDGKVPFGKSGGPLVYVPAYMEREGDVVWKDNFTFQATLRLTGLTRGRSAARFIWHDDANDIRYEMFMADMVKVVQNGKVEKGSVTAEWTFAKRGTNFGVTLSDP